MRKLFFALTLVSLMGVNLAPVFADEVGKGKVPFMTDLGSGQKFYVTNVRRRSARSPVVVKTIDGSRVLTRNKVAAHRRAKIL